MNRLALGRAFLAKGFQWLPIVLVVLASGLIASAATAETIYDFSFSGSGGVSITGGSLTVDENDNITSISGVVSGSSADGIINGLLTDTSWFFVNTNKFYYPANPGYFIPETSVGFYTGSFPDPAGGALQSNAFQLIYSSATYILVDGLEGAGVYSIGSMSASPAGGGAVPEIDPAMGGSALSLVAGVLAMIEQRRRRATLVA
jgi:hypothetical protein